MKSYTVKEWMNPNPITAPSQTTIPDAYWLMVKNKIRRLLVVDNEKLTGIVTIDDLRQKIPVSTFAIDAVRANDILANCPIRKVMSRDLITTPQELPLVKAAKIMLENDISTLPVMVGENLVGIITESDIFRAFVHLIERDELE